MMKIWKRIVALTITGILTLGVVTGCGAKNPGKDVTGGPVTINYYGRPDDNSVESTIVKAFEEDRKSVV